MVDKGVSETEDGLKNTSRGKFGDYQGIEEDCHNIF